MIAELWRLGAAVIHKCPPHISATTTTYLCITAPLVQEPLWGCIVRWWELMPRLWGRDAHLLWGFDDGAFVGIFRNRARARRRPPRPLRLYVPTTTAKVKRIESRGGM